MNVRRSVGLLVLCGCNQIFGVRQTEIVDAAYFDAPIDAPFSCPPLGGPPPQFSRVLHQIPQDCSDYNASQVTGWAVARCREPVEQIAQGPINSLLTPIAGLESSGPWFQDQPRITPEGDELFHRRKMGSTVEFRILRRESEQSWTAKAVLTPQLAVTVRMGVPTRGLPRRTMITGIDGTDSVTELEIDAIGRWTTVGPQYTKAELGLDYAIGPPNLTPDGLRVLITGALATSFQIRTVYGTRASLADRFTTFVELPGVPGEAVDAFMTADCARVYFSAASSVLYVQQL